MRELQASSLFEMSSVAASVYVNDDVWGSYRVKPFHREIFLTTISISVARGHLKTRGRGKIGTKQVSYECF